MEHANDYMRDITAAFVKIACNRKVDDAVMVEAPAKKGGKKKK